MEIPKKNGKSEFGAGQALYSTIADDDPGAEVYSAAGNKEQAGIVYSVASQMCKNNDLLRGRLKTNDSVKRIVDHQTGSFYQVLSSETETKHGISPSCVIFDEIHAQPNDKLWRVLTHGTDYAREQQIVMVLTTAGEYDQHSIWWKLRSKAQRIAEGKEDDPTFLPVLYIADKDADVGDRKLWIRVNPSINEIFTMEKLERDYKQALKDPVDLQDFKRFRLNIPVNQIDGYIGKDEWDACGPKYFSIESYKEYKKSLVGRMCYGGIDLSSKLDLTAVAWVFPREDDAQMLDVLVQGYVPEDNVQRRSEQDNVPYKQWIDLGLLTATPGNVIDYDYLRRDIQNAVKIYNVQEIGYDPWKATELVQKLQDKDGIMMVEMRQGMKTLSDPTSELLVRVKSKKLQHMANPVLRWCADNLTVKKDINENVMPDKDRAKERIDEVVALILGLGRAIVHEEHESVYEKRGVRAI